MEEKSNNFILFRNFINLSFSYMTFVIKENFDKHGFIMKDYKFDLEGYDFIINKSTIFCEGTLASREKEKLIFILENY